MTGRARRGHEAHESRRAETRRAPPPTPRAWPACGIHRYRTSAPERPGRFVRLDAACEVPRLVQPPPAGSRVARAAHAPPGLDSGGQPRQERSRDIPRIVILHSARLPSSTIRTGTRSRPTRASRAGLGWLRWAVACALMWMDGGQLCRADCIVVLSEFTQAFLARHRFPRLAEDCEAARVRIGPPPPGPGRAQAPRPPGLPSGTAIFFTCRRLSTAWASARLPRPRRPLCQDGRWSRPRCGCGSLGGCLCAKSGTAASSSAV